MRIEAAQHPHHARSRHTQRQRRHLGEHLRRHPVHPDSVVDALGRRLTAWGVRGDDERFMTRATEMLQHPQHRVGDSVDVGQKGLGDNRNAHTTRVCSDACQRGCAQAYTTRKTGGTRYRASMRYWSVLVVALVMLVAGCSREIAGVAQVDPRGPATALSKDGFGIVAGDPNAPGAHRDLHRTAVRSLCRSAEGFRRRVVPVHEPRPARRHLPAVDVPGRQARRLFRSGEQRDVPGGRTGHVSQGVSGLRPRPLGPSGFARQGAHRHRDRRYGPRKRCLRSRRSRRCGRASPRWT